MNTENLSDDVKELLGRVEDWCSYSLNLQATDELRDPLTEYLHSKVHYIFPNLSDVERGLMFGLEFTRAFLVEWMRLVPLIKAAEAERHLHAAGFSGRAESHIQILEQDFCRYREIYRALIRTHLSPLQIKYVEEVLLDVRTPKVE